MQAPPTSKHIGHSNSAFQIEDSNPFSSLNITNYERLSMIIEVILFSILGSYKESKEMFICSGDVKKW